MKDAITYDKIHLECKVKIQTLYNIAISVEPEEHAVCSISGIIDERYKDEIMEECIQGGHLKLFFHNNEENTKAVSILFQGKIISAQIDIESKFAVIHLQAVSHTSAMDIIKKRRSFQNINRTYKAVINEILKEYDSDYLNWCIEDTYLEYPLLQYDETDWEFIKRICSHLKAKILPEHTITKPGIHVGLINGKGRGTTKGENYRQGFCKNNFFEDSAYSNVEKRKYIYYTVEDINNYNIGDYVFFRGISLRVCTKDVKMTGGILSFTYKLSFPEFYNTQKKFNRAIKGMQLQGTVIEVREEKLKLHLMIDTKDQEPYFFDWKPITGNMLYCMPEKGQKVDLYFPDCDEKNAMAVNAVRSNSESCGEIINPDKRYYTTAQHKRIYFFPEETGFEIFDANGKHNELKINDNSQIFIKSDKKISIMSEKQVALKGKNVNLTTPKEATLVRKDILSPTVINLCNAFDAIGKTGGFKSNQENAVAEKKLKPIGIQAEPYKLGKVTAHLSANIPEESSGDEIMDAAIGSMPVLIGK